MWWLMVVPLRRRQYGSDAEFLEALEQLGQGLAVTCGGYSSTAEAAKLPRLRRVRVGLVGGGKYAGKVPKVLVARSLLRGVARGAAEQEEDVEYEFAYDEGVFEKAWQELQAEVHRQHVRSAAHDSGQDNGSALT
mmetsp:Transcript_6645/g.10258  ORF Transcript_6645/g.10258 Transcript_6645/m.10258 type:complete len:135 (+) Transcript_6645:3-407(+)